MDYLSDRQIDFIPNILKNRSGSLYEVFQDGILGIFDYLDGENVEDYELERLLNRLVEIYKLPTADGLLRKEVIDYCEIDLYKKYVSQMKSSKELVFGKVYKVICKNEVFLNHCMKRLEALIGDLKKEKLGEFITHGDAGGNVIVKENEFWIIDWDDPVAAPIERDLWFFAPYVDIKKIMNQILKEHEIEYVLSDKLIAYYTYRSLIYYLIESFHALFELKSLEDKEEMVIYIDGTINGWIRKQIAYADRVDI
jgi:hypothetical protein